MSKKAKLSELEELHSLVASSLATSIKNEPDVKTLMAAMKFLKDNEITVDIVDSKPQQSLLARIDEIAKAANNNGKGSKSSVEDLLQEYV